MSALNFEMPDTEYHLRPELSSTQARQILDSPAKYRDGLDAPREEKAAYDFGTALHSLVLGTGALPVVVCDANGEPFDEWRTAAAKVAVQDIRDGGGVPVKADAYQALALARDSIMRHPIASALLSGEGASEVSGFWTDPATGVKCRMRADRITTDATGRPLVVDVKSAVSAKPAVFAKHAFDYGYHVQQGWYQDGHEAILGERPGFLFVVVEKTRPYNVAVIQLDDEAAELGRHNAARARELYDVYSATDQWPTGYGDGVNVVSLPKWAYQDTEEVCTRN